MKGLQDLHVQVEVESHDWVVLTDLGVLLGWLAVMELLLVVEGRLFAASLMHAVVLVIGVQALMMQLDLVLVEVEVVEVLQMVLLV